MIESIHALHELNDPIYISALQHWVYCPRQCGLIHLEQVFEDNIHTARGQAVHRLVHESDSEVRADVKIERSLPLWSKRLNLIGKADLVEFWSDGTIYPVEFKHGRKGQKIHDDIQLTAQALCLEEMLSCSVPRGAIYHASSRRRREVIITPDLRKLVESTILAINDMFKSGILPPPFHDRRCRECSLKDLCQPEALSDKLRYQQLREMLFET